MVRFFNKVNEIILFLVLQILRVLPIVGNKFLFISSEGRFFNCNPKYLYLEISKRSGLSNNLVWAFDSKIIERHCCVKNKVEYKTFSFYLALVTSKYIVVNYDLPWFFPKRKKQVLIQTWHGGGAYKKVGRSIASGLISNIVSLYSQNKVDLYLSSSRKFTEVQMEATGLNSDKFLKSGMPRNALLLKNDHFKLQLRSKLDLDCNYKYVLYAPTYRGNYQDKNEVNFLSDASFALILHALRNKFGGEWKFIVRLHPSSSSNALDEISKKNIINGNDFNDMQELMVAADVLITDYSSAMWDFSLTRKPGFIFAPDIEDYINARGFYTDTEEWPYPISLTLEQLIEKINNFNQDIHSAKVQNHLLKFVSYENANSSFKVLESIGIL